MYERPYSRHDEWLRATLRFTRQRDGFAWGALILGFFLGALIF